MLYFGKIGWGFSGQKREGVTLWYQSLGLSELSAPGAFSLKSEARVFEKVFKRVGKCFLNIHEV